VLSEQHKDLTTSFEKQLANIRSKNTQLREMQDRVDQAVPTREATLLQLNKFTAQHTELTELLGKVSSDLAAEKRAHQTTQERASKGLSDKNNSLVQIQKTLTEMTEPGKTKHI